MKTSTVACAWSYVMKVRLQHLAFASQMRLVKQQAWSAEAWQALHYCLAKHKAPEAVGVS